MMHVAEGGDDDYCEPRPSIGLLSCLVPQPKSSTYTAKGAKGAKGPFSYNQLYPQPLRLTVLKLDRSSFGIEVEKTGTVKDLKWAVEVAFGHLPKMGPGSVSWEHVWGQFCLCYEGQKLLNEEDYIGMIGIKDGDELQFTHHVSYTRHSVRVQSENEHPCFDNKTDTQNVYWDGWPTDKGQVKGADNSENAQEGIDRARCEYSLSEVVKGRLSYHKLSSRNATRVDVRCSSSTLSSNIIGSLKNCLRFSNTSSRHNSRVGSWKRA